MQPRTCESDKGFEVLFEFFLACGESAEVFESGEAAFDAIALSIEFFIVSSLLFSVGLGGHDGDRSHGFDMVEDSLAVIAFVGKHPLCLTLAKQFDGLGAVVDLAPGHEEVNRQAQFIGEQMDLRRQTSSGAPQSLVRAPFLRPVAACWWARTMVESIMR